MGKRMSLAGSAESIEVEACRFGGRLGSERPADGLAPVAPAVESGISLRMVDCFERCATTLLAIETLEVVDKRQALQLLDALTERGQLKRRVESRA
jgi:hypothetical protein